jgi:hypothetical protein
MLAKAAAEIPQSARLESAINQRHYLIAGELRQWSGRDSAE